jgi:4'-phosphopantetheinyl transferase
MEQTEADVPSDNGWLAQSEVMRLESLRFPKRRADWRLGRWTAKCAVALYTNAPANPPTLAKIEIRPEPSGAPRVFIADEQADVSISLSHRAGTAACAITSPDNQLGCDLELIESRSEAFVADYFTVEEQAVVADAIKTDRDWLVTLMWSAKESALKAMQIGLRMDTRSVSVDLPDLFFSPFCDDWQSLSVRIVRERLLHGWAQRTTRYVRTIVTINPSLTETSPARPWSLSDSLPEANGRCF